MEIHILELPKLTVEQKNETDLMQWMRFLGGKSREDFEKMAEKNPEMKEAYEMSDRMSADERKRLEYEERQKLLRDKNMILKDGKCKYERGLREGIDRINQLNVKLSEFHRTEDILKATTDKEYQKKLFEEFGL